MTEPLCLDFISTVTWNGPEMVRRDQLGGYGQLLDWAVERGVLSESEGDRLREEAAADPGARRRALGKAWAFRRSLHDCFRSVVRREQPPEASVALLNAAITDSPPAFLITPRADGIAFTIPAGAHPDPLRPILWSALHLLSSTELGKLRECAAEQCGKLYLDHTRNGSRRWCDMETCGNRAKARRHQARKRGQPLP